MKAVRPTWVRKCYWTLGVTAGLGVLAAIYIYFQITAPIEPEAIRQANILDAREADRKLKIYDDCLKSSKKGYIRLSEREINSYIQDRFFSNRVEKSKISSESSARLLNSKIELWPDEVVWFCWLKKEWLGRQTKLVWQRTFHIDRGASNGWTLTLGSMKLGNFEVPGCLWSYVQTFLGDVDQAFVSQANWLAQVPAVEINTNAMSLRSEVRLFTYSTAANSARKTVP